MRIFPYFPPALFLLAGFVVSCNGDDNIAVPTAGFLEVTTITTGAELDPDGYTVRVMDNRPWRLAPQTPSKRSS